MPQVRFLQPEVQEVHVHQERRAQRCRVPLQQRGQLMHHFWLLSAGELRGQLGLLWELPLRQLWAQEPEVQEVHVLYPRRSQRCWLPIQQQLQLVHYIWLLSAGELRGWLGCVWGLPQVRLHQQEVQDLQVLQERCSQRVRLPIQQQLPAVHDLWMCSACELCRCLGRIWILHAHCF